MQPFISFFAPPVHAISDYLYLLFNNLNFIIAQRLRPNLYTTVLAYQHFQTFSERLKDFPCKVDYLSRARSAKEVSKIVKELADGKINILVGTHKIIVYSFVFPVFIG